jgi:hypothetical protein
MSSEQIRFEEMRVDDSLQVDSVFPEQSPVDVQEIREPSKLYEFKTRANRAIKYVYAGRTEVGGESAFIEANAADTPEGFVDDGYVAFQTANSSDVYRVFKAKGEESAIQVFEALEAVDARKPVEEIKSVEPNQQPRRRLYRLKNKTVKNEHVKQSDVQSLPVVGPSQFQPIIEKLAPAPKLAPAEKPKPESKLRKLSGIFNQKLKSKSSKKEEKPKSPPVAAQTKQPSGQPLKPEQLEQHLQHIESLKPEQPTA